MRLSDRYGNLLSVLLVFLLLVQVNALPIHEFNLRQQGYELVYVPLGEWPGESAFRSINGTDVYNIALCETHFQIQAMAEYEHLAFFLALLSLLGLILLSTVRFQSRRHFKPCFFSPVFLRAPPV